MSANNDSNQTDSRDPVGRSADLRTRITAAIMQTCHGVYMDDAVNAADAVIRELKLDQPVDFTSVARGIPSSDKLLKPQPAYCNHCGIPHHSTCLRNG